MGPPKGGGGGGGGGGRGGPWDEDRLDASEEGEKLLGTLMFEEEGEAKTTKAFKKLEENKSKKPWEQARPTLEATQGQILSQSPTDATRLCMGVD